MGREARGEYVGSKPGLTLLAVRDWTPCLTSLGLCLGRLNFKVPFQFCDLYSGEKIKIDLDSSLYIYAVAICVLFQIALVPIFNRYHLYFLLGNQLFPSVMLLDTGCCQHDGRLCVQVSLASS